MFLVSSLTWRRTYLVLGFSEKQTFGSAAGLGVLHGAPFHTLPVASRTHANQETAHLTTTSPPLESPSSQKHPPQFSSHSCTASTAENALPQWPSLTQAEEWERISMRIRILHSNTHDWKPRTSMMGSFRLGPETQICHLITVILEKYLIFLNLRFLIYKMGWCYFRCLSILRLYEIRNINCLSQCLCT